MNVIVVRATLTSTTLTLPELAPLIGKHVEIVVCEDPSVPAPRFSSSPTATQVLLDEALVACGALSRLA